MSMLTPPGMGGQYRIKGDRYPRMRPRPKHRRKFVFAGLATAMVLGLVGWGSLQLVGVFTGTSGDSAQAAGRPGDRCRAVEGKAPGEAGTAQQAGEAGEAGEAGRGSAPKNPGTPGRPGTSPTALPEPGKITVNVLNATPRSGLAAKTAKELKKRGFTVGEVANAPEHLDHKVEATGLLIGGTGAGTDARMKVLGTQLEGAKARHDEREGEAVDLVLGNDFKALADRKDASRALRALAAPSPKPSPDC